MSASIAAPLTTSKSSSSARPRLVTMSLWYGMDGFGMRRPSNLTILFGQSYHAHGRRTCYGQAFLSDLPRFVPHFCTFNFFTKLKESCFVSFTKGERHLRQCIAWSYTQETKPANTRQQEQFVIAVNSSGVADLPATTNIVPIRVRGSIYSVLHE